MPTPHAHSVSEPELRDEANRFAVFYRELYYPALRFVRVRAAGCDIEALLADAFELAWIHLVKTGELNRGWFYKVLRHKVGDFYRSAKRLEVTMDPATLPLDLLLQDGTEATETDLVARRVLERLSPVHAEPLLLVFWLGCDGADGARALGIREGTFRVRLHRAKRAFEEELDRQRASGGMPDGEEVIPWTVRRD